MTTAIIEQIIQSEQPIDWITQHKFAEIIGLPAKRLYKAKEKMPEHKVWQKINNKIYFSLKGWNAWQNEQATKNYQQALGSSERLLKSTSKSKVTATKSSCRTHKRQQVLPQVLELVVN
ncbi:hypothetical protein [Moraxella boevrei]|uniref:hypothetical protein n=1 Tax=Faucicola boevrei TaxID=346665 RepID=UPI003735CBCA